MILSDRDIRAATARMFDPLVIDPGFPPERLQPASLELTLHPHLINEWGEDWGNDIYLTDEVDNWDMHPGAFVLASTAETVKIPNGLVAVVNGKSSLARLGLTIHQTGGFIDPGFRGMVTLEMVNASHKPIKLRLGMPICQLVFMQMSSPADRPYGSAGLGSHYMDQVGPTPSRSGSA